ncbi:MAG: hypothetical protein Fur0037_24900 [Planctomycetota bacterium]
MSASPPFLRRAFVPAAILSGFLVLLGFQAAATPLTVDEPSYLRAGIHLREHLDWTPYYTYGHGPLPFFANQILSWLVPVEPIEGYLFAGRVSMLVFPLLAAVSCWLLARSAFGAAAGAFALWLFATTPLVLGHGALMTTDMSLVAFYALDVWALWRFLERPSWGRAAAAGGILGLALATKYLAVFLVPVLAFGLCASLAGGFSPGLAFSRARASLWRRLADSALAALAAALSAFIALWACYAFAPPGYPADHLPMSRFLAALRGLPLADPMLGLLPKPWVLGIDYMTAYSEHGGSSYLCGRRAAGFPAYYLIALGTKLPLGLLGSIALGLVWRRPRWPGRLAWLVGAAVLVPLLWLSFRQVLQIGLRYLLPILPLLCAIGSRPLADAWDRGLLGRRALGRAAALAVAASTAAGVSSCWPDCIGSFNLFVPREAFRWFCDSNVDWSLDRENEPALRALRERWPDAQRIRAASGPRLGSCLAHAADLAKTFDEDGRASHWLRSYRSSDEQGAFFAFRVDDESFEEARRAASDPARVTVDYASALATSGQPARALSMLDGVEGERADAIRRLCGLAIEGRKEEPEFVSLLLVLGRFDLVLEHQRASAVQKAQAHMARDDPRAALKDFLEAERLQGRLDPDAALLMAFARYDLGDFDGCREVLSRYEPAEGNPLLPAYRYLREKLDDEERNAISTLRK